MLNDPTTGGTVLRCPKCDAAMRTFERNGIHIDRCTECGGLFLDRGELERLVDAEAGYYSRSGATAPAAGPANAGWQDDPRAGWRDDRYRADRYRGRRDRDDDDDDDDDDDRYRGRGGRRRGFLDDLLDFG